MIVGDNLQAIGTVTGSNLFNSNTGDQTIAGLSGNPTAAQLKTSLAITESDVSGLSADLAARAMNLNVVATIQTASFSATANTWYQANPSTAIISVALPTSTANQTLFVKNVGTAGTSGLTPFAVNLTGTINGVASATLPLKTADQGKLLIADGSGGWLPLSADISVASLDLRYDPLVTAGTTAQYYRGDKTFQTLNPAAVGLGNLINSLQLVAANNLSDLTVASTARTNLGLGTMATQNASAVAITGGSITGQPTPVNASDVVIKSYADSLAQGIYQKHVAAAVATTNQTTTGLPTTDGVTLTAGQIILLTAQTVASQNGLWSVASTAWTRPSSFATGTDASGSYVFIESGTNYANSGFSLNGVGPILIDTTAQTWVQFTGVGEVINGTGLNKSGNTLSLTSVGTPNTYAYPTSVTTDVTGRISAMTAGTTTGSGNTVLSTSPTLVSPALGTPTALVLTNSTGLPLTTGVTGALNIANGGTGLTGYSVGDILYWSAGTGLSKLNDVATGNVIISGGVATVPSYGKVGLTTHVTGILPVANGGTGSSTQNFVDLLSNQTAIAGTKTFTGYVGFGTVNPYNRLTMAQGYNFSIDMQPPYSVAAALASGGSLTSGTTYYYKISATDNTGETLPSTEVSATPTGANLSIALTWGSLNGAYTYRIYRSTTSGVYGATSLLATVSQPASSPAYTDTGAVTLTTGTVATVVTSSMTRLSGSNATSSYINSGFLGIGTPNPGSLLHIYSPGSYPTLTVEAGNDSPQINLKGSGGTTVIAGAFNGNQVYITPGGSSAAGIAQGNVMQIAANQYFMETGNATALQTLKQAMSFTWNTRWWNGTSSQYNTMSLTPTMVDTSGNAKLALNVYGTELLSLWNGGLVGINTGGTKPLSMLQVNNKSMFGDAVNTATAAVDITPSVAGASGMRIRTGVAPTTPNDGDVWYDSTQKALFQYLNGGKQTSENVLFTNTTYQQVVNTTTTTSAVPQTGIGSRTLPANFWTPGKKVRVKLLGTYQTPATPGGVTFAVMLGSVQLATVSIAATLLAANSTTGSLWGEATVSCLTAGTTGTFVCNGYLTFGISSGTSTAPFSTAASATTPGPTATATFNTTAAGLLDVVETWTTTNAAQGTTIIDASYEVLN